MPTSVVPSLIDALLEAATAALPDVLVLDGYGNTNDPGDFLMIGAEDPDSVDSANSASAQQAWANANYTARDETGTVSCVALSWNGDADQKLARDTAYAITAEVENLLRANPSLDIPELLWTGFGDSLELVQAQSPQGAAAQISFSVFFRARI